MTKGIIELELWSSIIKILISNGIGIVGKKIKVEKENTIVNS